MTTTLSQTLAVLTVICVGSASLAGQSDDFDGGLEGFWTFASIPTSGTDSASSVGNVLELTDSTTANSGGAAAIFGITSESFSGVLVAATVNPSETSGTNGDIGLLAHVDAINGTSYNLTIDYDAGNLNLERTDTSGQVVIGDDGSGGTPEAAVIPGFSDMASYYLELEVFNGELAGRVFDEAGGSLLASLTASDSTFTSGPAGVVISANDFSSSTFGQFDDFSAVAIPEPASMVLAMGVGVLGLTRRGRRRAA